MEDRTSLVLWFKNGETALFKNVTEFRENEGNINFSYFGQSTKVERKAVFNLNVLAGMAIEE